MMAFGWTWANAYLSHELKGGSPNASKAPSSTVSSAWVCLLRLVASQTSQRAAAGYKLQIGEVDRLLDQVDVGHTGHVAKGQLAASQIDWATLQADRDAWLRCVRRAFEEFDADHDGVCGLDEIVACLKTKLPLTEVSHRPPLHADQAM